MNKLLLKNYFISCLIVFTLTLFNFAVNGTNYYVSSSTGKDTNTGTSEDSAWRSLERVNKFFKLYPGDQVLFKRGDEWDGSLKVNSSGTEKNPILYGAYGNGPKPKFYGSENVSGEWQLHAGNIYKTSFSKSKVEQLFFNNERLNSARYPKTGYLRITSVFSATQFTSKEINGDINYKNAQIMIRDESWSLATKTVSNSSYQTINIQSATNYSLNPGEGFFFTNKLEFLTQPGEWYYDANEKLLYIWTPNGDSPSNYNISVSYYDNGISIISKQYIGINDLVLSQCASDAVKISSSSFVLVNSSLINSPGKTGILINEGSTNVSITNNSIEGANDYGIQSFGTNNTFERNIIKNIKLPENISTKISDSHSGVGIYLEDAPNSIIKYNIIENTGSGGIQFYTSPNSIIENNFIKNSMLTINDGGGIYCWSSSEEDPGSENSLIAGNIIENTFGNTEGTNSNIRQGHGIYIDDRVHNIAIINNTVINSSYVGIFLHNNKNIIVRGNSIFDSGRGIYVTYSFNASNNVIKNNIIFNSKNAISPSRERPYLAGVNSIYTLVALVDSNRYIDKHFNSPFRNDNPSSSGDLSFANWKKTTGWDTNSTFDGNPLLRNEMEGIFYNETTFTKKINLGKSIFKDVYGNNISGTISLKPFTSIILIGKDFDKINQSPTILDQSFNFISPKFTNDTVGKVVANDPDSAQIIYYSIVQANDKDWFAIDSLTGMVFTKTDIQTPKDISLEFLISVTDSAFNSLSDTAKVTIFIDGHDISPPIITSFVIPPQYLSLTIPITSLTATDDVAVVDYILTETFEKPEVDDINWSTISPDKFTFSNAGTFVLYAWAKDSTGNVSESKSDTVHIFLPDMSPTFSEYLFEESTGSAVLDSKGSKDGIIINEIFRDEGVIGSSLNFNSSGFVNLGHSFGENVAKEISISTWIKPGVGNDENQAIIFHGGPNSYSFALFLNSGSKSISFNTNGTNNPIATVNNVQKLWDGNWHHLVVTYNGFEKTIFVDNIIFSRFNATGEIESGWGYNLLIGAGSNETSPAFLYHGMMDETRIFNYALNSDEIRELFDSVNRIYKKISTEEFISICQGEEYFGWTETGKYERVLKRKSESDSYADSTVITHLQTNKSYKNIVETTICEGEIITLGSQIITLPGEYTEVYNSVNGCDSIIFLKLNVIPKIVTTEKIDICEGENYIFGTQTLSTSGEFTEIYKSVTGCDSIVTLKLTVNPGIISNEEITISNEDNYFGWNENGIYQRWLKTITGCDSIVVTNLKVVQTIKQNINLNKGWNIISSYLIPLNENMGSVMEKLRIEGHLVRVQDESNNTYEDLGVQLGWVNNIGNYQKTEGYKIRVENDCNMEIAGLKIELPLNITLHNGINLISFPVEGSFDAMLVIEPLINSGILEKVQDERGNSIENWKNTGWINGIGNFKAGEGYIIKVNENGILTINDISQKSTTYFADIYNTEHFKVDFIGNGYAHMNINVVDLNNSGLKTGDEIAVFDNTICVGAIKLNELHFKSNRVSIPASSSETNILNGFIEGNSIDFKIWNKDLNTENKLIPETINGNMIFKKQESVFIKLNLEENLAENVNIYPNPSSGNVSIRFLNLPEDGADIHIFDISGKQIFNRKIQTNIEVLNIENLPAGVYFIKTLLNKKNTTTKLIVI